MENQQLILILGEVRGGLASLGDKVDGIAQKVDNFPCVTHSSRIESIERWKSQCNGFEMTKKVESYKGGISLKNAIYLLLASNAFTVIVTLVTNYFISHRI